MKGEAPKILLHDCRNKPVFDIFLGNKSQVEVWKGASSSIRGACIFSYLLLYSTT